jgi:hypothetical protein
VRVDAGMGRQFDLLDGDPRKAEQPLGELALGRREGEDGATMVGVGVEVEEPRRCAAALDRLERTAIPPLADVRNGEQERRLGHSAEG